MYTGRLSKGVPFDNCAPVKQVRYAEPKPKIWSGKGERGVFSVYPAHYTIFIGGTLI